MSLIKIGPFGRHRTVAVRKIKGTYAAGCGVSGCRTRFSCHGQSSVEYTNESKLLVRYNDHSQFNLWEASMCKRPTLFHDQRRKKLPFLARDYSGTAVCRIFRAEKSQMEAHSQLPPL